MGTEDQYPPTYNTIQERMCDAGDVMRDAQADMPSTGWLQAQLAFKNSMVHGILQFTPSIAFCYVLHRCVSRDIRCRESFMIAKKPRTMNTPKKTGVHVTGPLKYFFPWHVPCRGLLLRQRNALSAKKRHLKHTSTGFTRLQT